MSGVRCWIARMLAVAAVAGALPTVVGGAAAQDGAESTYLRYHEAVRAAERCRDRSFGTPEHARMAAYIDDRTGGGLTAGRQLELIEDAKRKVDQAVDAQGCAAGVAESLALFDTELAPLVAE